MTDLQRYYQLFNESQNLKLALKQARKRGDITRIERLETASADLERRIEEFVETLR